MLKDSAVRRALFVLTLACIILSIDILFGFGSARADESVEPPVSALILQQCGKTVGVVITDSHGVLHPVPPQAMNDSVMGALLTSIPQERRIVATVKCDNGTET